MSIGGPHEVLPPHGWRQPFGQLAVRVIQISRDQTP